ncbi:flagellar assembly protein FliH [Propionivibrio dicarboxylicus]|uniref:Flagellar assembly protein FliH n=1 Tax=Propionivibrio dicarboxylicus TaxID=83767 RepID=A0A1G8HD09_9RHOO|nr:flagellar assembly protein FliH [Propionivibrio dicarboxylicus]SDI04445.1 flagellar assembly protein FliH [Propionivibrio dicarboxylicus]
MTGFVPKEKLTAYQRWELAAFDEVERMVQPSAAAPPPSEEASPAAVTEAPLVLPTAADIERMHAEAHEQGYAVGYEEGLARAREISTRLDVLMTGLKDSMSALEQDVADNLLATAVEIARQVVHKSLSIRPEFLIPVVREAITALHPHPGHPLLFVHPDDAELIRTHLGEQLSHNNWRIIEDSSLTQGGCRVEHGASEVDATVETRWRRTIESIGITQEWLADMPTGR